ncbi:diguanylate cyclase [Allochromatium humboldtianum]|uniref:diguanylate cyclase n=1 Tax=Allochromatium humboldtianum TaxID=504901 RepID=A0A850R590_9GAMM|nr:diguanylate cyclase [Allochromatium humboldtianum]NVZ08528.1 diguanylate cyclase [Allochromatium humboldtianum]
MPAGPQDSFQERKRRLRASFIEQLPDRLRQARELLSALTAGERQDEPLSQLHLIFHTLKGSGASFGFDAINASAKEAEQTLREVLDGDRRLSPNLLADLRRHVQTLEELKLSVDSAMTADSGPRFALPAQRADEDGSNQRLIYLCDDDALLARDLSDQLGCFGYRVEPHVSLESLREAVLSRPPAAMIMDIMFPEGRDAGPAAIAELNARLDAPIPCLFMSMRDDFQARLRAIKAGGHAYCRKPVKAVELAELLDQLTSRGTPDPYHILIVDDDPDVGQFYAMVLEAAGMVTRVASEPERVPAILEDFDADLVLMDLYMPKCSGPELARVLRQIPGYLGLPIIYVSSETDARRQFKALQVGADGFLTKPIEPERLVTEVHLRAERMRTLRSLMIRDSLTGLFNHNTILQLLKVAMASCQRTERRLCLAMIDVDHFKAVNDTHGHPIGDQVLMALGRTLRLRLRESDIVGRYGGEEFAVIMTGLDAEQAKSIMDALRESFAAVTFLADGAEFHCTFSGGLAAFPEYGDPSALIEAADAALYQAKRAGRNRILIAHTNSRQ